MSKQFTAASVPAGAQRTATAARRWVRRLVPQTGALHPLVWPVWALAAASTVSLHPLHNLLIIATVAVVVSGCHTEGPMGRSWGLFVRIGLLLLLIRVCLSSIAVGGVSFGRTPLWEIPRLVLPRWAGGIELGGTTTLEMVLFGLYGGLRLWTLLLIFGAFNAVADQYGLLRRTPRWLFGAGLIVTIGLAWIPQAVLQFQAIREAQRVRGLHMRGWRAVLPLIVPLLTGGLERAVQLAEAMDSRGYGRGQPAKSGLARQFALLIGVIAIALGLAAALGYRQYAVHGWTAVAGGGLFVLTAVRSLSRSISVTRYTRDRWQRADVLVLAAAMLVFGGMVAIRLTMPQLMQWDVTSWTAAPRFSPQVGVLTLLLTMPAVVMRTSTEY